jgi:hypothetical protein
MYAAWGLAEELISDTGPLYGSAVFAQFLEFNGTTPFLQFITLSQMELL